MSNAVQISPMNSLILVMDPASGKIPASMGEGLVAVTHSCIAVGTLSALDGETSIAFASEVPEGRSGLCLAYEGILDTPRNQVFVCTVEHEIILSTSSPGPKARIAVWVNDASEPNEILIQVKGVV